MSVSIHAPLARSNTILSARRRLDWLFQYMLLLRGATHPRNPHNSRRRFNTCSSCEEQLFGVVEIDIGFSVSIHAPLARSNLPSSSLSVDSTRFNTCSSCEEQRAREWTRRAVPCFNTCSSCEEQLVVSVSVAAGSGFNTCSSCEEQPFCLDLGGILMVVSIHAPLARSNLRDSGVAKRLVVSIHAPLARSNSSSFRFYPTGSVSIHAPLARSNRCTFNVVKVRGSFNTCSSCEEQLVLQDFVKQILAFQYMLLLRGATTETPVRIVGAFVSIHAPLARSNSARSRTMPRLNQFQYMLLLRGATSTIHTRSRENRCFNTCSSYEEQRGHQTSCKEAACFNTCSSCEEQHP